jgi:ubiquinone/menaquinone biosynthesis C-methylase UbiE
LVFGEVAETYDRALPSYPQRLVDDVVSVASLGARGRVLEVGCGTGKATLQFASRGLESPGSSSPVGGPEAERR